jgi:hypothetical protein
MYRETTKARIIRLFSDLEFEERRHLYKVRGISHPSVSRLVESHCPKFDGNKIVGGNKSILYYSAKKASKLEGKEVTEHELQRRWQLINTTACDLGHKVHSFLEDFTGMERPSVPQEVAGIKYIKSLEGKYRVSFRELKAYSREFGYAGTMDLPLEVVGQENQFVVADYKTNGDLFKAYDYMYAPFEYLESSPYNKYQLQLSYYQIMLEEAKLEIVDRHLIHLKADETFQVFPTWNYTAELRDYLRLKQRAA